MKKRKVQKVFVYYGFGFPVKLLNVPMIKVRGAWTPYINYNELARIVLLMLCSKHARLTGNEVRCVRLHCEMNLQAFAKRFNVSHAAVIKWEKTKDRPTMMNWSTEKDLRLFLLSKMSSEPKDFSELYLALEEIKDDKREPIQLDVEAIAA